MHGYFDHNATTPLAEAARRAWLEAADAHWHNPSSLYREAGGAKRLLEEAREELAALVGCEPNRMVFNSGATEANNALYRHLADTLSADEKVAVSAVEHPCVRDAARASLGARVLEIPVDRDGVLSLEALSSILEKEKISLVSVMATNNETGVLQPWREALEICRRHGASLHCDAAQWFGKLPPSALAECDFVTASAHKFGGAKGAGFIILSDRFRDFTCQRGGPQESGHRAGTENYPAVASMVAALRELQPRLSSVAQSQAASRDRFEECLLQGLPGSVILGAAAPRLWNTSLFLVPGPRNLRWLTRLSARGFAVSTGSACSSGKNNPSHVLEAMGRSFEEMGQVIRVSGGWDTSSAEWEALAKAIQGVGKELEAPGKPEHTGDTVSLLDPDPDLFTK